MIVVVVVEATVVATTPTGTAATIAATMTASLVVAAATATTVATTATVVRLLVRTVVTVVATVMTDTDLIVTATSATASVVPVTIGARLWTASASASIVTAMARAPVILPRLAGTMGLVAIPAIPMVRLSAPPLLRPLCLARTRLTVKASLQDLTAAKVWVPALVTIKTSTI